MMILADMRVHLRVHVRAAAITRRVRAALTLRAEWVDLCAAVAEFEHTRCARVLETRKLTQTPVLADFQRVWDGARVFYAEDLAAAAQSTPPLASTRRSCRRCRRCCHCLRRRLPRCWSGRLPRARRAWMPLPSSSAGAADAAAASAAPLVALRQTLIAQAREWLSATHTRQRDAMQQLCTPKCGWPHRPRPPRPNVQRRR
jgi:hypothetical protein